MISSAEQVTPGWLTAALHESGAAPRTAWITDVAGSPMGGGKLARCVRYRLDWSEPGAGPATVIGKFPADDDRTRSTGVGSGAYRRELLFYRHLAPLVKMSVPRCHLAEFDVPTGEFALVLSDAAPARTRDQTLGASPDDVAAALEELVLLQAPFWGGTGLSNQGWLPAPAPASARRTAAVYRLMAGGFVARFGSRLSAGALSVLERFAERDRRWAAADRPPYTLTHGDFRLDNLLFGAAADRVAVTVVDWQTVAVGPAVSDVAYLIGGALTVPVRRSCEDDLYQLYRRSLEAAGVSFDDARCHRDYRIKTLGGLHMTVVGAMLVAQDPASDAMFLSMAERHCAHVTDLEAFDVLDNDR